MHKSMRILKLPINLAKDKNLLKLSKYIEGSQIIYSSIIYTNTEGKQYLINKNQQTPYFQLDWKMYSIMRSWAKTIVLTGAVIRYEKETYLSRSTFGDRNLEELYTLNLNQNQDIVVCTKTMNREEISSYINQSFYNIRNIQQILPESYSNYRIKDLIKSLNKQKNAIILEFGTEMMKNFMSELQIGQELIDLVILSQYEGFIPENCIGKKFDIQFQNHLTQVWESDKILIDIKGIEDKGFLKFRVYSLQSKQPKQ